MRDAPSVTIADLLTKAGARVRAYDPVAMPVARTLLPNVEMCDDPYELAAGCDALMVVTDWNEFKQLDFVRIKNVMKRAIMVDGRNIYDPQVMKQLGFRYRGLGRGYNDQ